MHFLLDFKVANSHRKAFKRVCNSSKIGKAIYNTLFDFNPEGKSYTLYYRSNVDLPFSLEDMETFKTSFPDEFLNLGKIVLLIEAKPDCVSVNNFVMN